MVYFKKIKEVIAEYEAETGKHITLHDLFVNFLNYIENLNVLKNWELVD